MKNFEDFNLSQKTEEFIRLAQFQKPTPIQQEAIPAAVRGKDIIGLSRTGTGKTHAYLIPLMQRVDSAQKGLQAVVTAPTRELAAQIFEKAKLMQEADPDLRIKLLVGGMDRQKDIKSLQAAQPHIVIGTPGRIKDLFLNAGVLRCDEAGILVVDEADMTLEFGFLPDIDAFAGRMKERLQMMAFSATMPEALKPFLKKYMHHPLTVRIDENAPLNPQIRHILVPCRHHTYAQTILSILPGFMPYVCLIFANTREDAAAIAAELRAGGIAVSELHGDMESRKRKQAMRELAQSEHTYVVCTDLAARGIDIDAVTHVISCGFPEDLEYYIHRAGRTARYGKDGICYALYHEEDDAAIRSLMRRGIHFEHMRYKDGEWQSLKDYGWKRSRPESDEEKKIAMILTRKNAKVKPGYKKKKAAEIEKIRRKQKRAFIRGKIQEERKAVYKERQRAKRESGEE